MNRFFQFAAIVCLLASASNADPYPHRKSGLWQVTMTMTGSKMGPISTKYCVDAATEEALWNVGQSAAKNMCSKDDVHFVGGAGTVDTVCKFGKSTVTTHTVISFAGNTAYHSEAHSQMRPPMIGSGDRTNITDAKWVGPCPADMKPGDMIMANGMRMNVNPNAH